MPDGEGADAELVAAVPAGDGERRRRRWRWRWRRPGREERPRLREEEAVERARGGRETRGAREADTGAAMGVERETQRNPNRGGEEGRRGWRAPRGGGDRCGVTEAVADGGTRGGGVATSYSYC